MNPEEDVLDSLKPIQLILGSTSCRTSRPLAFHCAGVRYANEKRWPSLCAMKLMERAISSWTCDRLTRRPRGVMKLRLATATLVIAPSYRNKRPTQARLSSERKACQDRASRDYGLTVTSTTAWSSAPRLSVTISITRNVCDTLWIVNWCAAAGVTNDAVWSSSKSQ